MDLPAPLLFLAHPAVQYGLAPFLAALFTVMVLHRLRLGGLALAAAFCTAVWLTVDWTLYPLTPLRKLILIGLVTPPLGLLVDFMARESLAWRIALAALAAAASIWVHEPAPDPASLAAAVILPAWLVMSLLAMNGAPGRSSGAIVALAGGTAVCAAYGEAPVHFSGYAASLASGAGAFLLWLLGTNRKWSAGAVMGLPAATLTGLLLGGAVLQGGTPWSAALLLALVPLAARIPAPQHWALRSQVALVCLYTLAIAAAAVYTLWRPWPETAL